MQQLSKHALTSMPTYHKATVYVIKAGKLTQEKYTILFPLHAKTFKGKSPLGAPLVMFICGNEISISRK